MAPPLDGALESSIASPQFTLPEFDANQDTSNSSSDFGFTFPGFSFGGSMELMAVPKRKVTPHKRGIRNGPKALKPSPVIIRCKSCGQVKLPHFYCCSGDRGKNETFHLPSDPRNARVTPLAEIRLHRTETVHRNSVTTNQVRGFKSNVKIKGLIARN